MPEPVRKASQATWYAIPAKPTFMLSTSKSATALPPFGIVRPASEDEAVNDRLAAVLGSVPSLSRHFGAPQSTVSALGAGGDSEEEHR